MLSVRYGAGRGRAGRDFNHEALPQHGPEGHFLG